MMILCSGRLLLAALLVAWPTAAATAQAPQLLLDINAQPVPSLSTSSLPDGFARAGSRVVFAADASGTGRELYVTDGTTAGTTLLKDIATGPASSSPTQFTAWFDSAFFIANDGVNGNSLWITNGTAQGTNLVKTGVAPTPLVVVGGILFFSGFDAVNGQELWKSDGSASGTLLVMDIRPGRLSSSPSSLAAFGSTLLFQADDGSTGRELWRSDGNASGTNLVLDIAPGGGIPGSSLPDSFTSVGGKMVFAAMDPAFGFELWSTDGTTIGTQLVRDIFLGPNGGLPPLGTPGFSGLRFAVSGGTAFFAAAGDTQAGFELWATDGTAAGTRLVADIDPTPQASSKPSNLTLSGSAVFFTATDSRGLELWQTSGSGASLVQDINPGASGSGPTKLTAGPNGQLLFVAFEPTSGTELWSGNAGGASLVKDISPGTNSSVPTAMAVLGSYVIFGADDGVIGKEVWRSSGSGPGTTLLANLNGPPPGATAGSAPNSLADVLGTLFLSATDGVVGAEPWKSDGTPAGTALLKDINAGSAGQLGGRSYAAVGNTIFFNATDAAHGAELWKSDGTAAGTALVADIRIGTLGSSPSNLTVRGNDVFFVADDGTSGTELWKSDGTAAGTQLVKDIWPGIGHASPSLLTAFGRELFFRADDGTAGRELWKTDGTAAGTIIVKDIRPGSTSSALDYLTVFGRELWFAANDGTNGSELWKSDGTAAGTVLVKDIYPGSVGGCGVLRALGATLLLEGFDPVNGVEPWKTDGTATGTMLVKDVQPGPGHGRFLSPTVVGSSVFFLGNDGVTGTELWKTDGTAAGTVLVRDLVQGTGSSTVDQMTAVGSRILYFACNDGASGKEPWLSDGTPAGTRLLADVNPGSASSNAMSFTLSGGRVLFVADDAVHGNEPWLHVPGATARPVGQGCAASGPAPELDATDPVLGSVMFLTGVSAPPATVGFALLGLPMPVAPLPPSSCFLYVNPSGMVVLGPFVANPGGDWRLPLPLPRTSTLSGVKMAAQALFGYTATPLGVDLTNGAQLTLGS